MLVDLRDGACRECGSQLEITDFDDCTMTVLCTNPDCGDSYDVETDAFNDGCTFTWPEMMARKMEEGGL